MFNGIYAAQNKQNFIYRDAEVDTDGNPLAHAILRGANTEKGGYEPNYYYDILLKTIKQYEQFGLKNPFIVIDTNHDNSGKITWSKSVSSVKPSSTVIGMKLFASTFVVS